MAQLGVGSQNPGRVRFSCMLWEPDPIPIRPHQEFSVVYNATTLAKLPKDYQTQSSVFSVPPYGIHLKSKYVYRDTFLRIGNETLNSDRPDMRAENGDKLYDDTGKPMFPYIEHQTFVLDGSLFSGDMATPTGIKQASAESLNNGLSIWRMTEAEFPFDHDGHNDRTIDGETNDHDYLTSISKYTTDSNFAAALDGTSLNSNDKLFIKSRATRRFMPMQVATSSDQKLLAGGAPGSEGPKGIHWLCLKETPLFQGEDFFVEFHLAAFESDIVRTTNKMRAEYKELDALIDEKAGSVDGGGSEVVPVNGGVIDIDGTGEIVSGSQEVLNLNNQPYYLIELGVADPKHNYFILIAQNAKPVLIHRGTPTCVQPASDGDPARLIEPDKLISRRLSEYTVSCKQLMSQPRLRITVRNHLGRMVIIFSGYENDPWVIGRDDYKSPPTPPSEENEEDSENPSTPAPIDKTTVNVPMITANSQIRIGAGNIKCSFTFAPLHYSYFSTWQQPHPITVKGPLEYTDVKLLLSDSTRTSASNPLPSSFFQDAELYFEWQDGHDEPPGGIQKTAGNCPHPLKDPGKDKIAQTADVRNAAGAQISYIDISMVGDGEESLTSIEPSDGSVVGNVQIQDIIKMFDAQFTMRAGDADLPCPRFDGNTSNQDNDSDEEDSGTKWRLWNCITPIATGWRLVVDQNGDGHGQTPVEVAHHVERFNHTWTYSDNNKIEHSGTLKFNLNAGQSLSFSESTSDLVDQKAYIASLSDKMFFVRIYAWWESGYMDCANTSCPCRRPGGPNAANLSNRDKRCVFTGFCMGGDITVQGQIRSMECQLLDYMRIMQDQPFVNSPFFDGMSDYSAVNQIVQMANLSKDVLGDDYYAPASLIDSIAGHAWTNEKEFIVPDPITQDPMYYFDYTLPSSYDLLQNPFFKFRDLSKYDEAINQIGTLASKVCYFDRFGRFRMDVRPDVRFRSKLAAASASRRPKCNFMTSQYYVGCGTLDLLAIDTYTYKRPIGDMYNEIFLVGTAPEGAFFVNSVMNYPGRYDPTSPGWIGYPRRLMQMEGIWGSERAIKEIGKSYAQSMFKPPIVVSWKGMGLPHIQAMDLVTFTALDNDDAFPATNVEAANVDGELPKKTATLILTSVSSEIDATNMTWENSYEGEWLYGNIGAIISGDDEPEEDDGEE